MSRDEAIAEAQRRNDAAATPGFWAAREAADGDWEVVEVTVPGVERQRPTGSHTESRARPESPGDPRPAPFQNVPPYGAG